MQEFEFSLVSQLVSSLRFLLKFGRTDVSAALRGNLWGSSAGRPVANYRESKISH
jgi:hypothetical protein